MKRWVAAFVAVLFLATAAFHSFAHHGESDDGCAVCQVQASSLPAVSAPRIVVVRTLERLSPAARTSCASAPIAAFCPPRAPPAFTA